MTTVLLILVNLGIPPVQFRTIAACEQAYRDILTQIDHTQPIQHACVVVKVK
jgi:hypothetical protein